MLFSQRKGLKTVKNAIQIDSIDDDLKNSLWTALSTYYWSQIKGDWISTNEDINILIKRLWIYYFKKPVDTIDDYWPKTYKIIREYFFNCKWNEIYDFLEFIADNYTKEGYERVNKKFIDICNSFLEQECSAYRFINGKITQITDGKEISEIEEAIRNTEPLRVVNTHLKEALNKLSDRKNRDYRNSIKESISAVESLVKLITGKKKAELGEALKFLESRKIKIHGALKKSFSSLYGYTSDADGIRHALMDEPNLSFSDAKFMLVSCSAFVNYLIDKARNIGLKI